MDETDLKRAKGKRNGAMRWKKGKRFKKALESSCGGETGGTEMQKWRRMEGGWVRERIKQI